MLEGKKLLITGGTGSFGNTVLDKFINSDIAEIRILSRDEKKQHDMRIKYNNEKIKFIIGDVRDYDSVASAMKGVDYVFSAAALKHVPSCEFYPIQAVRTNVLGTQNVLTAAIENDVSRVVVLSTDKAVYPINAMGMTKALMEKVTIATSRDVDEKKTMMCNTRYGNVMASRGSVIPLFTEQVKKGQPITITDPNMTRFMMSLPEAVDLVMYAFENGHSGDTFVQKAPAATIKTLAEAIMQVLDKKVDIKILGTRHGEKKHETLLSREEFVHAVDLGNYYRVPADNRDLNYHKYFDSGEEKVSTETDYTSENTQRLNTDELAEKLLELDYINRELGIIK